jgi:hypothetical protein
MNILPSKYLFTDWHWWLMPVILVPQETEIRRIKIRDEPGQKKQDPISKHIFNTKKD